MRLRKIKLSGFKSFVDPTTLVVPGNLVGIVGPNGCGKSNIIDAVTWVMGESSAKHLRGDALIDVIFNGSSTRQPVGQASVELLFDNTDGQMGGQYASYNEISVKRQINREAISTYYLNGTRCRRKDIQALFLGTGLGPRSYAIIEQGVISRLIEAKPEDLRIFIEEAAGISKFRERRKETENRIRHTRENINRLNDIRDELGKQLIHLQRQARAAERYQVLKQDERRLKAELLALNWRELKSEAATRDEKVRLQQNRVEENVAGLRQVESEIEKLRNELTSANEIFNAAQSNYYQIGSDISQIEQKVLHTQERIQTLQADIGKLRETEVTAKGQLTHDRTKLLELTEQAKSLEPELHGSRSESDKAYNSLNVAEQAVQSWQTEWDALNEATAGFNSQIEVDATRLEHLESGISELRNRRQILTDELNAANKEQLHHQTKELAAELEACNAAIEKQKNSIQAKQSETRNLRDEVDRINENLSSKRSEQQKLGGKIASLEALQSSESGADLEHLNEWLSMTGMEEAPRLISELDVEPRWTLALETVMAQHLQDICVAELAPLTKSLGNLVRGKLGVLAAIDDDNETNTESNYPRLIDKVTSKIPLNNLLHGVYIADDLDQALLIHRELNRDESVITQDGIWLGHQWLRVNRQGESEAGMLSREQEISRLKIVYSKFAEDIKAFEKQLENSRQTLEDSEQLLHENQQYLHEQQEKLASLHSRYAETRTRYEQMENRINQVQQELGDLEDQEGIDKDELSNIRYRLERTENDRDKLDTQRQQLLTSREQHKQALENARLMWQSTHEQSHEIALQMESISSQKASLEQAIKRGDIQTANIMANIRDLESTLASTQGPLSGLQQALEIKLAERIRSERDLSGARENVQAVDMALREKEQKRTDIEQIVQDLRSQLENVRLAAQEISVRLQTVVEQLQAGGHEVNDIIANLSEQDTQAAWQEKLESVERKIQRLGPINLAAIDEYNQLTERKVYLDSQHDDLAEALDTLENAIRKIDRETRTRFKETYDKLNDNLKEMFPILFGGGHAYLEMIGDDLLETGVTLMARPPGKRNSTIHLLSGGEKALTAVALVFAIFKLNPAPFCILDEVDAPLDDTNVGRFSQMVKEMSTDVQFIIITHNKITMEIAHQLLGVTMQEAGVSRLVSVDMDEAIEMAASA